jgi:hypothetical protein
MSEYSVRIELHAASDSAYNALHKAMWGAGFRRFIMSDKGKMYLLPTGSYVITASQTLQDVFAKAKVAADSTGKSSWIWMVEWSAARFILEEIEEDPDAPRQ